jgi:signal transduction histidine kinase
MPAVRRDGTEFPVELSILRLPGDGPPVFTGFLRDITQQQQAEAERANRLAIERKARAAAELAESKSAFLVEATNLLAASLDYETTLRQVAALAVPRVADWCVVDILEDGVLKPLAVSHVDRSRVELVEEIWRRFPRDPNAPAGPARVARTGRPEFIEQISEELLRRVSRSEEHFEMQRRLRLGSSVCVPLEARGELIGALSFVYETGGRRYSPEDVAFAESLAQRASLAIDNARLFRQAHDAIRLRDEFLSIASHELKTPITTLKLQVQSLLRRSGAEADAAAPRVITLQRQIERLHNLVDKLLDISRLTAGRLELELEPVDLDALVREVLSRFDEELRRSGSEVVVRGEGPNPGRWDRSRLDQVVTNLIANAIKYGGGRPIHVTLDGSPEVARLEVRDHGIGIAPENLGRIFQRFERAVSERHYGGLGLGLWIVHQIVEALGGTVQATSRPGEGAVFVVELPREPPPPAQPAA